MVLMKLHLNFQPIGDFLCEESLRLPDRFLFPTEGELEKSELGFVSPFDFLGKSYINDLSMITTIPRLRAKCE